VDKFFFSVAGISPDACMDSEQAEVRVKQIMLSRARTNILLADHSKFERYSTFDVLRPSDVGTLVTDSLVSEGRMASFRNANVTILRANVEEDPATR